MGPAGNCITAKEKGTIGSFRRISELGLNAQEIEFVRSIYMQPKMAEEVGEVAKELGISLSVHAPYYINLNSQKKQIIEASKKMIFDSADRAERMGAGAVAIHSAYYSGFTPQQTYEKTKEGFLEVLDKMKSAGIKNVKLGVETMGRWSQFGSLDECMKLAKEIDIIPFIDWSHLFVRGKGTIDYGKVFDVLKTLKLKHIYSHFQNVEKNKKGEFVDVHKPLDHSPPFEPLAKEILRKKIDITIICESPIIEADSQKMKEIFNSLGYKL